MSHLSAILIASAAFAALFAFIELCDRLTPADGTSADGTPAGGTSADGSPTRPATQEADR